MSRVSIIGAYNTKFGSFVRRNKETGEVADLASLYDLMMEAGRGALKDAGVSGKDVDGVWVGSCAPGLFANQEHVAAIAPEIDPEGLRSKPMTRCEDACASGSVALYNAVYAVESGRARIALVLGVEKMNLLDTRGVTHALATCSYWPEEGARAVTFPCLFAEYAKGYAARHGLSGDLLRRMLASVTALAYRNGLDNPLAHFGRGGPSEKMQLLTAQSVLDLPEERNPVIAEPLRLHDCSLISDGAAAVVIMESRAAARRGRAAVEISGIGHVNERIALSAREGMHELTAGKEAARRAFARPASASRTCRLPRSMTASRSTSSCAPRRSACQRTAARDTTTWRAGSAERTRNAGVNTHRRPEGERASGGSHRRLHARPCLPAAHRDSLPGPLPAAGSRRSA